MALENHLLPGETVTSQHGPFYATPQRLLRYVQAPQGEELRELPYTRLIGMELVNAPRHPLMILGTLVTLGGVYLAMFWGFVLTLVSIPFGLIMVVLGGVGREAYYQLRAQGMSKDEERLWRVDYRRSQHFINTLQTIVGERWDSSFGAS